MKKDLLEILKTPNDKLIAVDLDGTLCHGIWWGEGPEPKPNQKMVDLVWDLYKKGAHIIIYTGRQPRYYKETQAWLMKNDVPFHGIAMQQKIGADLYIDDMALNAEEVI